MIRQLGFVDPQQMAMGMRVEREHTANPAVAAAIACDHLRELPDYYTRLARMERGLGLVDAAPPPAVCAPYLERQAREQRPPRPSRKFELALVLGGTAVSLVSYLLAQSGYPKIGAVVTVGSILVGGSYAAVRLLSDE